MNHPTDTELSDFIYDDLEPSRRTEVVGHLQACSECRARVAGWREARAALQTWSVPDVRPRRAAQPSLIASAARWAVAACIFVASGFALARLTTPRTADVAHVDPVAIETLRAELKRDLSVQLAALHSEYRAGVDRQIRQIEAERVAEYAGLRKDVETVALRTQEEFVRLTSTASATPSSSQQTN